MKATFHPLRTLVITMAMAGAVSLVLTPLTPASAQGIPVIDAATLAQTITSVGHQANMLTQQVTMVQQNISNLMNLPSNLFSQYQSTFGAPMQAFRQIYDVVNTLQQANIKVMQLYNRAQYEMNALQMTQAQWAQAYLTLAQTRGGQYQQMLNQDIVELDNFSSRAQELQALSAQYPNITGNVQGLALLNQTANAGAMETLRLRQILQRQVMLEMQSRIEQEQIKAASVTIANATHEAVISDSQETQDQLDSLPDLKI